MKRMLMDLSSVCWMSLHAGKDKEHGKEVLVTVTTSEGLKQKPVWVNSATYAYENAMNHVTAAMTKFGVVPSGLIIVQEGAMSKTQRKVFLPQYKEGRDAERPQEAYDEFNKLKAMLVDAFCNVGAQAVTQDGVEADDIIAYLAKNLKGERIILSNDGDLLALVGNGVHVYKGGEVDTNPYGPFPHKFITVYKALVGDSSDKIPGAFKFGEKAFLNLYVQFGDEGLEAMQELLERNELHRLQEDVGSLKELQRILDDQGGTYASWKAAKLYPEWCNTMRRPLIWKAGMVRGGDVVVDERLRPFCQQVRLITANNYDQAVAFFKAQIEATPIFCLDLETTVPEESEEWLAQRTTKGGGVDVLASTIVGCGLTFGANSQYGFYFSRDHADTNNITLEQLGSLLTLIPQDRMTIAHNAAGFELPVLFTSFGETWKGNGWRGMFPNMVDSRIAASYWDENQHSHGLKQLSKLLLGYEQVTYEQVTTKEMMASQWDGKGRIVKSYRAGITGDEAAQMDLHDWVTVQFKMNELTAAETVSYGIDDVFCTVGIWNHFVLSMELENTWDAFMRIEQKPMYLSALSFILGTPVDIGALRDLKHKDRDSYAEYEKTVNAYLIGQGWDGTQCPVYTEMDAAKIKEAVQIVLGMELKTKVRTPSKIIKLVENLEHPKASLLAGLLGENNLEGVNTLVAAAFDGTPVLDVASPKQLQNLMYQTMKLPIRMRNKATAVMRAKGVKEGTPRTDDEAMAMAIKMGDADPTVAAVLQALVEMKSINTRNGLYWEPYPKMLHWMDQKLHPEVRQCATNTRRHTASSPNIQQQDEYVRTCILPHRKDAVFVSCDLGGQEIRLLADMSRDANMMSAYMGDNPKDLHSFTAAMILGISYDEFVARRKSEDKEIAAEADKARQIAKVVFFASSYGAMAPKIAEGLGVAEEVAQGYLDALDRAFPRVKEWKAETEEYASSRGWVPIHGGTRRHLTTLLLSEDRWEAQKALRQASNARIQSAGGNQLRTIMGRIWDSDLIDAYDFQFYWPVHDEVCFSVHRKDAVPVIQKLHGFMCEQFLDVLPSASSIGIGPNFGALIEIGETPDAAAISKALVDVFDDAG